MTFFLFVIGTVGRLETNAEESAKHDLENQEMDARHAENKAGTEENRVLGELDEEAKHIQQEIKKVQTHKSAITEASY